MPNNSCAYRKDALFLAHELQHIVKNRITMIAAAEPGPLYQRKTEERLFCRYNRKKNIESCYRAVTSQPDWRQLNQDTWKLAPQQGMVFRPDIAASCEVNDGQNHH